MKTHKRRGLLAKAGALLAVAALAFSASPSYAQTTDVPEESGVIITKLDQPDTAGTAATGVPNPAAGAEGIPGVVFEAYAVTLNAPAGTNDWQREIAATTLETAKGKIGVSSVRSGTTDADGIISWTGDDALTGDLKRGLYLIRESSTPEGVVGSGDFLLAVPMTNPDKPSEWLSTIYVYPKADTQGPGSMKVANATDYAVGDIVTWTVNAEIPQIRDPYTGEFIPTNRFEIWDALTDAELTLAEDNPIRVKIGDTVLSGSGEDPDYEVVRKAVPGEGDARTGETVKIVFTEKGRDALVEALNGDTEQGIPPVLNLTVEIDTNVQSVGEFDNGVTVYPGNASENTNSENNAYTIESPEIKYGNITLVKEDTEGAPAPGADFRVYASEGDALAKNDEHLKTVLNPDGEWTTATEDGEAKILLDGFRYSAFADGDTATAHEYYLVEMSAPEGQQLLAKPVPFTIESHDGMKELEVTNTANTNAFVLPLTGGSGTALLTILGLGILAIVLFVARSRRNAEA